MTTNPSRSEKLIGHSDAEKILLDGFNTGRLAHGWLICGEKGVGKATLAYHFAKFLVSQDSQDSADGGLFGDVLPKSDPQTLNTDPEDPAILRICEGSHSDVLTIEVAEDKKEITVDSVRKIAHFLTHTAAESAWRIVIIDSADEMNRNAANAVLKLLEEPPENAIFMLVANSPGKLLPTIRSRCRVLNLRSLAASDVAEIIKNTSDAINDDDLRFAVSASAGSPGRALEIYELGGAEIFEKILAGIANNNPDLPTLHSLGDSVAKIQDYKKWKVMIMLLEMLLMQILEAKIGGEIADNITNKDRIIKLAHSLEEHEIAEIWSAIQEISIQTDALNLDRKSAVMEIANLFQDGTSKKAA